MTIAVYYHSDDKVANFCHPRVKDAYQILDGRNTGYNIKSCLIAYKNIFDKYVPDNPIAYAKIGKGKNLTEARVSVKTAEKITLEEVLK
jgi:hypothetical protein